MLPLRWLHTSGCASCRIRASIATKQWARSRQAAANGAPRLFTTTTPHRHPRRRPSSKAVPIAGHNDALFAARKQQLGPEEVALRARQAFRDAAPPEGALSGEEQRVYERLYGSGFRVEDAPRPGEEGGPTAAFPLRPTEEAGAGTALLREGAGGVLEEIEFDEEVAMGRKGGRMTKGKKRKKRRGAVEEEEEAEGDGREEMVFSDQIDEDLARQLREGQRMHSEDSTAVEQEHDDDDEAAGAAAGPAGERTHPLTAANRFGPSPLTVQLPKDAYVDPATLLLSAVPTFQLRDAAHRVLGGVGLPYSTSTPSIGRTMQQKPIALDASQSSMSDVDADVFMSTLMPGMYASVLSVLAETRKRLGTAWAESLVKKAQEGSLRILDAGGAGAGILAVREVLRAEWERMHDDAGSDGLASPMALAEADGKVGGESATPPLGSATVLTGSDTIRKRASQLLDNTTFVPRLPNYLDATDQEARAKGKFDLIVAPHTLWPLQQDHIRKVHTSNLWSLLDREGGVLCLLEKGVGRGFEVIAGAREMLLETRISSPESRDRNIDITENLDDAIEWDGSASDQPGPRRWEKEKGMIIAPCTNHAGCPMYVQKGFVKGRKEICHFEQRYIRPRFLQRVLSARDKNFEDVKFSYLAVMRGRDLREQVANPTEDVNTADPPTEAGTRPTIPVIQGKGATDAAFEGFSTLPTNADGLPTPPSSLTLPRTILPPLKRRGHVILDLCTPSGTLERWTVPKSYGKQAYRDARKSRWGDLWALGAKTRVVRSVRSQNKHALRAAEEEWEPGRAKKSTRKGEEEGEEGSKPRVTADEYGRVVVVREDGEVRAERRRKVGIPGEGGKMRTGGKVKGVRDKRDKSGGVRHRRVVEA